MKKLIFTACFASIASAAFSAAIEQVIVRQQWPWSTDVKVEYKLSGVTAPVDLTVTAYNGSTELALPDAAITGDRYGISEDGVGQIVIDPIAAFGTSKIALANFKVKLTVANATTSTEVLYKVFDFDNPTAAPVDVTRADFLNGKKGSYVTDFSVFGPNFSTKLSDVLIWTELTNSVEYMTSKLVMRKIPAKNKTFTMGTGTSAHSVTLTNDFWMAVFPITRSQYDKIGVSSSYTHAGYGVTMPGLTDDEKKLCPRGLCSWKFQGRGEGSGADWPTDRHKVKDGTLIANLRAKFNVDFDMLTEAQWDFAARAGSVGRYFFNDVTSYATGQDDYKALGEMAVWFNANAGTRDPTDCTSAGTVGYHPVGTSKPNAYGIYGMFGNAYEECLDWYAALTGDAVTEPEGPTTGTYRVMRGGSYVNSYLNQNNDHRNQNNKSTLYIALRVMLPENLVYPDSEK